MPHSLRAKLSGLRYKGILEDKDYKRLCKALDKEDVLEQIRAEIEHWESDDTQDEYQMGAMDMQNYVLRVIDKWGTKAESMIRDMPTVDVFDKIRGEIEQSFDGYLVVDKNKDYASNTFKGQPAITINHVFEIINKYKAESEEQK